MLARKIEMPQIDIPVQVQPKRVLQADCGPNRSLRTRCLLVVLFLIAFGVFATARSATIVSEGYALVDIKSQAIRLEKENEILRLEVARLKSPQRIQAIAVTQLGMVVPTNVYCSTANSPTAKENAAATKDKDGGIVGGVVNMLKAAKAEASSKI